jgi:hypothetical protein
MGTCCVSVRSEDKLEDFLTEYEIAFWPNSDFSVCSKQIDIHGAAEGIHRVRIPMLIHSLGFKLKNEQIPGIKGIFEVVENEIGWNQRRLAVLCSLCCSGSNLEKAAYLLKMYGTDKRLISRDNAVELIADAVNFAVALIPKGAIEALTQKGYSLAARRMEQYCNLLTNTVEDLCLFLLTGIFSPGYAFIMAETFNHQVCLGKLKCLCNSSVMRKLGVHLAKRNKRLDTDDVTWDESTIREDEDLNAQPDDFYVNQS